MNELKQRNPDRLILGLTIGLALFWLGYRFFTPGVPAPPVLEPGVALRPVFYVDGQKPYRAGTAVAIHSPLDDKPVVLTALHLLGPSGGLDVQLGPAQLDARVRGILLTTIEDHDRAVAAAKGCVLKTGHPYTPGGDASGDMAAFHVLPKSKVKPLDLASADPRPGRVGLAGRGHLRSRAPNPASFSRPGARGDAGTHCAPLPPVLLTAGL